MSFHGNAFIAIVVCAGVSAAGEAGILAALKTKPSGPNWDSLNAKLGCKASGPAFPGHFRHGELASQYGLDRVVHMKFAPGTDIDSVMGHYRRLGCFEYVERNTTLRALAPLYPNDYYFSWQWGMDNQMKFNFNGVWIPKPDADIDGPEAWAITSGDSSVIVAIIDSGCKTDHPELAGRIWRNPGEIPGDGIDNDRNGYIDDIVGWDFWYDDNNPEDSLGHGTGVTGVLAANGNNGVGHAGVDWQCKLMILKVMGNTQGSTNVLLLATAIRYAADNGAHVINMSLGDERGNTTLSNAIAYAYNAGVVLVAAVGNDAQERILYPAAYANVIAVGSSDPDDGRSAWFGSDTSSSGSNYGPQLDVVAPGQNIFILNNKSDTTFDGGSSGTSLASPVVAGIASLLLAQDPARTPAQIRTIIQSSADDTVGDPTEDVLGWDKYMGWGRVSAYKALTYGQTARVASAVRVPSAVRFRIAGGILTVHDAGRSTPIRVLYADGRQVAAGITNANGTLQVALPSGVFVVTAGRGENHTIVARLVVP